MSEIQIADWVKKITGDRAPLEQLREWEHRIVGAYSELLDGYKADPGAVLNNIARVREHPGLVLEQGINFTSLCFHHLCVHSRGPSDQTMETVCTYAVGSLEALERQAAISQPWRKVLVAQTGWGQADAAITVPSAL